MGDGEERTRLKINLTSRASRDLAKLVKTNMDLAKRVSQKVDSLSQQPMLGKQLKGQLKGSRSLRVGDQRIIYKIDMIREEILVINIGPRRDIYSR